MAHFPLINSCRNNQLSSRRRQNFGLDREERERERGVSSFIFDFLSRAIFATRGGEGRGTRSKHKLRGRQAISPHPPEDPVSPPSIHLPLPLPSSLQSQSIAPPSAKNRRENFHPRSRGTRRIYGHHKLRVVPEKNVPLSSC